MTSKQAYETVSRLGVREQEEDKFLIYHDERGYETNTVGAEIVQFCREERTFDEICQHVSEVFDVPAAKIEKDVQEVINQFVRFSIILKRQ